MNRLIILVFVAGSFLLGLGGLAVCLLTLGRPPQETLSALLYGGFGSWFGFSETLLRTVPILLCALAACIPAQGGQINIGGEGQLQLGAVGAVLAASVFAALAPPFLITAMVFGAILAGALWASVPALLKVKLSVNEALTSLFLNYVALYFLQYLVHGPLQDPTEHGWPMSARLSQEVLLERSTVTRLHLGVYTVIALAVLVLAFLKLSRIGRELSAVGLNSRTAKSVGIPIGAYAFGSFVVGGILAGLAGYYEIAAVQYRLRAETSLGFGYSGFLVAWMCRQRLWLLIPLSVLVAGLSSGADNLQLQTGLPAASADVVQGLLLLCLLVAESLQQRWARARKTIQAWEVSHA
jgi:ABC-type uncharacterized transport system permease subunit